SATISEQELRTQAELVVKAEDRAEAEKKIAELRQSMADTSVGAADAAALAEVERLFDALSKSEMTAEEVQAGLAEIGRTDVSNGMQGLLLKAIQTVPVVSQL